jgi:hypothetical protein
MLGMKEKEKNEGKKKKTKKKVQTTSDWWCSMGRGWCGAGCNMAPLDDDYERRSDLCSYRYWMTVEK